jgi:hypothetical protein
MIYALTSLGRIHANNLCFINFRESTETTGGRQKFQEKVTAYSCRNYFILV